MIYRLQSNAVVELFTVTISVCHSQSGPLLTQSYHISSIVTPLVHADFCCILMCMSCYIYIVYVMLYVFIVYVMLYVFIVYVILYL